MSSRSNIELKTVSPRRGDEQSIEDRPVVKPGQEQLAELFLAVETDDLRKVKALLLEDSAEKSIKEDTVLSSSMVNEKMDWLPSGGGVFRVFDKDTNATITVMHDVTIAHLAAFHGHLNIVRFLHRHTKTNFEARDKWQRTPIMYAVEGNELVVMYLDRIVKVNVMAVDVWDQMAFDLTFVFTEDNKKLESAMYLYASNPHFYDISPKALVRRVKADINEFDEPELLAAIEGVESNRFTLAAAMRMARFFGAIGKHNPNRREQFNSYSMRLENIALGLMQSIKDEDELAIVLQQPGVLDVAVNGRMGDFVSDPRLQQVLLGWWYGELRSDNFNYEMWELSKGDRDAWYRLFRTPWFKFQFDRVSFLTFLALISALAITHPQINDDITFIEIGVFLYGVSFYINEIDELAGAGLYAYLQEGWNRMDLFLCSGISAEFLLRAFSWNSENAEVLYTVLLASLVVVAWMRSFAVISMSETLGPLLIAVQQMAFDVMTFAYFQAVFVVAFSLAFFSVIDSEPVEIKDFTSFRETVLTLFQSALAGNLFKDFEGIDFYRQVLAETLGSLYLLIGGVVLVNLLIAQMGHTYSQVKERAESEFLMLRVTTILKYDQSLNLLPPPFNLIPLVLFVFYWPFSYCIGYKTLYSVRHCAYCHTALPRDPAQTQCISSTCGRVRKSLRGSAFAFEQVSEGTIYVLLSPFWLSCKVLYTIFYYLGGKCCSSKLEAFEDKVMTGEVTVYGRMRKPMADSDVDWDRTLRQVSFSRDDFTAIQEDSEKFVLTTREYVSRTVKRQFGVVDKKLTRLSDRFAAVINHLGVPVEEDPDESQRISEEAVSEIGYKFESAGSFRTFTKSK